MSLRHAMNLLVAALVVCGPAAVRSQGPNAVAFDGGGSGGGNPLPPNAIQPVAPTLAAPGGSGILLVTTAASERRTVLLLRSPTGELLDVAVPDRRGLAALRVPTRGALLDVLGTDLVGLPVAPGQHLSLVVP